jgi:hypothetical protein
MDNLVLEEINTGNWPYRLGEFQIGESGIWPSIPRESNPREDDPARPSSVCKLHTRPLVRKDEA